MNKHLQVEVPIESILAMTQDAYGNACKRIAVLEAVTQHLKAQLEEARETVKDLRWQIERAGLDSPEEA